MLEIISPEGISLDLPDDIAIEMEFNNPLFQDDVILGDYSLGFSVDATDTNKRAFKFADVIAARERLNKEYEGFKIKYGNSFLVGTMVAVEAPFKKLNLRFKTNVGVFKKNFSDVLPNYDFSDTNKLLSGSVPDINKYLKDELAAGTSAYGAEWPKWIAPIIHAPDLSDFDWYADVVNSYYTLPSSVPYEYFKPDNSVFVQYIALMPSLFYILKRLAEVNGYRVEGKMLQDAELQKLIAFTNLVVPIDNFYPSLVATAFYETIMALAMPKITGAKTFLETAKLLCQSLVINEKKRTISFRKKEDVLLDRKYIDFTKITSPEINQLTYNGTDGFELKYNFTDDDEFIKEEFVEFDNRTDKVKGTVNTIIDLPNTGNKEGDIYLVEKDNVYYIFTLNQWRFYSRNYVAKTVGRGSKKINLELTPLFMYNGVDVFADAYLGSVLQRNYTVPKIKTKGFGKLIHSSNTEVKPMESLRLCFYRGLANDSKGRLYPYASSESFDVNGNDVYNYNLRLDGPKGIYEKWHKQYIDYRISAKPVELFHKFEAEQVMNMNELFDYIWRIDEVNYRIENVRVTFYKYKIGIATSKGYTAY
jgi:hypothetical protein